MKSSLEEKRRIESELVARGEDAPFGRWLYIHELKKMLEEFDDDLVIMPNTVGNLNIYDPVDDVDKDDKFIAYIEMHWAHIEWIGDYDEEE